MILLYIIIIVFYIILGILFIKYLNRRNGDYQWRVDNTENALFIIIFLPLAIIIYLGGKLLECIIK